MLNEGDERAQGHLLYANGASFVAACPIALELLLKWFWFKLLLLPKCHAMGARAFGLSL